MSPRSSSTTVPPEAEDTPSASRARQSETAHRGHTSVLPMSASTHTAGRQLSAASASAKRRAMSSAVRAIQLSCFRRCSRKKCAARAALPPSQTSSSIVSLCFPPKNCTCTSTFPSKVGVSVPLRDFFGHTGGDGGRGDTVSVVAGVRRRDTAWNAAHAPESTARPGGVIASAPRASVDLRL